MYKFSYQKILDVKQIQEDQKSTEVALAQNELEEERITLLKLKSKKMKALNNKKASNESTADMLRNNSYFEQVNLTIDNQKKQIQNKKNSLISKKSELLEASKSRKILDKLKETDMKKFKFEQNKIEQKELDEISAKIAYKKKENKS
jgi:flagellar FliJ protein